LGCGARYQQSSGNQKNAEEHSAGALAIMRSIKRALDPKGIMNPGKMV
jgi:FAD/FMN-containing dehydrogenase